MAYLEEFQASIEQENFHKLLQLWEEYSNGENPDTKEFHAILDLISKSSLSKEFGPYAETALPLWKEITDEKASYQILGDIIDLQTTNTPLLRDLALQAAEKHHGDHKHYMKWIRLVGLRGLENFQYSLSNINLLAHMSPGKFVFHKGGWGTGEIMDLSMLREQVSIEFENVHRIRDLSFDNCFKTLIPLPDEHFLARRFGNPDALEAEARDNPEKVIQMLLNDLGPKTAADIKDELCELVIPEDDWTKWWQYARSKLKRNTMIETPTNLRDRFYLHDKEVTHEERLHKEIHGSIDIDKIILTSYNYVRDFPNMLKKDDVKESVRSKILGLLEDPELQPYQELEIAVFMEHLLGEKIEGRTIQELVKKCENIEEVVNQVEILAFKKRILQSIKRNLDNWKELYLSFLLNLNQNPLRDFVFDQLIESEAKPDVIQLLEDLLHSPAKYPEVFVWYFQKIMAKSSIPFGDQEGKRKFLEGLFVLLNKIELDPNQRELTKKIYNLITGKRFEVIRKVIEGCSLSYIQEFLLLVTKCTSLEQHDIKILNSLAQVVHPNVGEKEEIVEDIVWTTAEGYQMAKKRLEELGTVEIVENAKEIEEARALGDLRENSEYKSALERRSRLQGELKMLSDLVNKARVITEEDITHGEVGVGTIVDLQGPDGSLLTYSILGPWDADPDKNVLSFESKLAKAMQGCKQGDTFKFKDEDYQVKGIKNYI